MLKNKGRSQTVDSYTTHIRYQTPFLKKFKDKTNVVGRKGIKQILFKPINFNTIRQEKCQTRMYSQSHSIDTQDIQSRTSITNGKARSTDSRAISQPLKQSVKLPSIKLCFNCKRTMYDKFPKIQNLINSNKKPLKIIRGDNTNKNSNY